MIIIKKFFNNKKISIIFSVILVICLIGSVSYAYLTATINNVTTPESNTVVTGQLALEYTDGAEISLNNAFPGDTVSKEFTVKNTGVKSITYDVYFNDLVNSFADKTDFVYSIVSEDGGYNTSSKIQLPDESTRIINNQSIGVGEEHNYTLTIEYLNKDELQNDNNGKSFSSYIRTSEHGEGNYIILNTNNGIINNNTYIVYNSTYDSIPIPTKNTDDFDSWYLDSELTNKLESTTSLSGITNLYAKWKPAPVYYIAFNPYRNYYGQAQYEANAADVGTMENQAVRFNEKVKLSANQFSRNYYTFKGWSTTSGSQEVTYTDEEEIKNLATEENQVINLYPVWELNIENSSQLPIAMQSSGGSPYAYGTVSYAFAPTMYNNPDSYVTFAGETAKWRIIASNTNGELALIRIESLGKYVWNSGSGYDWPSSSLKTFLEGKSNYVNQSIVTNHNWYYNPSVSSATYSSKIGLLNYFEVEWLNDSFNIFDSFSGLAWTISSIPQAPYVYYMTTFCKNYSTSSEYDSSGNYYYTSSCTRADNGYSTSYNMGEEYFSDYKLDVFPVVYLKSNLHVSGSGRKDNPFVFSE